MKKNVVVALCTLVVGSACENPDLDGDVTTKAIADVKAYIAGELGTLHDASLDLQSAAPAADADGWNATDDGAAVAAMREQWRRARGGYERVEGAIAVIFPDLDASTDERYDGFIAEAADDNLFDDEGVTGVHAIERILWSDQIPASVITFEEGLGPKYVEDAFPATQTEAEDFKTKLSARLVADTQTMVDDFGPFALPVETAYRGVLGSMEEQFEKVSLAGTGEDESRYSQHTLADMRFNLEGGRAIFEIFEPVFADKGDDGEALYGDIKAAFDRVEEKLNGLSGDAIPAVPATWNPDAPSADDAATPYGDLYLFLDDETDDDDDASFVSLFLKGAELLEIPELAE